MKPVDAEVGDYIFYAILFDGERVHVMQLFVRVKEGWNIDVVPDGVEFEIPDEETDDQDAEIDLESADEEQEL